mmetsp:Transcript_9566/g.25829  ORF Transcript_9566/g.25829 Transcript_9566/m.25829 type:complete len:173 (-) Transcript_9566:1462-1980(-)
MQQEHTHYHTTLTTTSKGIHTRKCTRVRKSVLVIVPLLECGVAPARRVSQMGHRVLSSSTLRDPHHALPSGWVLSEDKADCSNISNPALSHNSMNSMTCSSVTDKLNFLLSITHTHTHTHHNSTPTPPPQKTQSHACTRLHTLLQSFCLLWKHSTACRVDAWMHAPAIALPA